MKLIALGDDSFGFRAFFLMKNVETAHEKCPSFMVLVIGTKLKNKNSCTGVILTLKIKT